MSSLPALPGPVNPALHLVPPADRSAPAFIPFETALLGGLISDARRLAEIAGIVSAPDFFRPDHARLFTLLLDMDAAGTPIEPLTVQEHVARGGHADRFGGLAYVIQLPDTVASTANLDYYARRIRALALARRGCEIGELLGRGCREAGAAPEDLYAPLGRSLSEALAELGDLAGRDGRAALLAQLLADWGGDQAAVLRAWLGDRDRAVAAFSAAFPRGGGR